MAVKFSNNAYSTLSGGIRSSATSFDVASASTFPTLGGSDHMYLSIIGSSYVEIIKVTGVSGTTLTCVRGQDGTTGTAADGGDRIELRVTTAMLTDAIADSNADIFNTIAVRGQSSIVADSASDTLISGCLIVIPIRRPSEINFTTLSISVILEEILAVKNSIG